MLLAAELQTIKHCGECPRKGALLLLLLPMGLQLSRNMASKNPSAVGTHKTKARLGDMVIHIEEILKSMSEADVVESIAKIHDYLVHHRESIINNFEDQGVSPDRSI
jgi:hypothetical protein